MKLTSFLLFCAFAGLVACSSEEVSEEVKAVAEETEIANPNEEKITQANMNAYMDYVMMLVGPWMVKEGWIPMPLPNLTEEISVKPAFITYKGELELWDGVLDRFDGVARNGNSMMYYDRLLLRIAVGAILRNIRYRYDYKTTIMELSIFGQTGWVEGGTDKFIIDCDFMIDVTDFYIYMQNFEVHKIGSVWTKCHGNWLTDWFTNGLINTMTFVFRGVLRDYISQTIHDLVQAVIDEINNGRSQHFQSIEDVQQFLHTFAESGFGLQDKFNVYK